MSRIIRTSLMLVVVPLALCSPGVFSPRQAPPGTIDQVGVRDYEAHAAKTTTSVAPTSNTVTKQGCAWEVPGVGLFTHYSLYDFSTLESLPKNLVASEYTESSEPYNIEYGPANVYVDGGYLQIVVPAGQTPNANSNGVISCGEIRTVQDQVQYAVVKTTAILSSVPGTCQAAFFYSADSNECDIEYISDPDSQSNPSQRSQPPWLQYTNQPGGNDDSYATSPTLNNANTASHEYRIDWLEDETHFYTDGQLTRTLTDYVPGAPGQWVWNNWSNGNSNFTVGPPAAGQDSTYQIQEIEMYYNVSGDPGNCSGN